MDFEEESRAPRRGRRKQAVPMFDGDISGALRVAEAHDAAKHDILAAEINEAQVDHGNSIDDTEAATVPVGSDQPAPAHKSRDIGNWRFTPWKGLDMWTHKDTIRTSFKEQFVRKNRHQ